MSELKAKLDESRSRISVMETEFLTAHKLAETENLRLLDEYEKLQERYDRQVDLSYEKWT